MNKTTIIYLILIIFLIYIILNLKSYNEKYTQTSVPKPNIYLPLTNYNSTITAVDNNQKPVIINGLSSSDFNETNGVFFDGSNNKYIMTPDLYGNYTICFNLYVTNITPNSFIFNQGQPYNSNWAKGIGLFIQVGGEKILRLGAYDPELYNGTGVDGTVLLLNKWNFVCITVESSGGWMTSSLWINGIQYQKGGSNRAWANGYFILGGQLQSGKSFTGYMRDFMKFSSTLTSDQINSLNAVSKITPSLQNMLSYVVPIPSPSPAPNSTPSTIIRLSPSPAPSTKYNITIPPSIANSVITFDNNTPMINPSNSIDNYTNYVNLMNPILLKDNQLSINGTIVNLYDLSIYGKKSIVSISFFNSSNSTKLYALLNNTYGSSTYVSTNSYTNTFSLSIDQTNNLSSTIQYANIIFSKPTIKLYNTLTDTNAITFTINSFTVTPTYTTPSQFIIQDNSNSWNNNLGSLNLSITYINNILTCQLGNTIQLINFTSTNPLTLSYNDIVINKFNSSGSGLFILDPTTIPTIPISTYQLPPITLTNVKLSSPDMVSPLLFSNIPLTPTYV